MFHRCFTHFDIGVNKKLQNAPRFEIDFGLNLPCAWLIFFCVNGSTIQLVLRELLLKIKLRVVE